MSTLLLNSLNPKLTNQQFINCPYLEILPFYVSLVFVVPVPCACTGYLYVPYSGHVMGTGQTETMEVSDSLKYMIMLSRSVGRAGVITQRVPDSHEIS